MKTRYILFQRSGVYYSEDTTTGKQSSLRTRDKAEAVRLLHIKNEAAHQPAMNLQIAQIYLQHGDPALASRTWQDVMELMVSTKTGNNLLRWQAAIRDKALEPLRRRKLMETTAENFLAVLKAGTVSTNVYLRRIHNYAVSMHWLPWPVLPKPNWLPVTHKEKRAITAEEHQKIIQRELNPATRAYYELLWHLGGAQTDIATLTAEDIDWRDRTISYRRHKSGVMSLISFGNDVAAILKTLPTKGELFPALARIHERHRAKMFIKRLKTVGVGQVLVTCLTPSGSARLTPLLSARANDLRPSARAPLRSVPQSESGGHRLHPIAQDGRISLPLSDYAGKSPPPCAPPEV